MINLIQIKSDSFEEIFHDFIAVAGERKQAVRFKFFQELLSILINNLQRKNLLKKLITNLLQCLSVLKVHKSLTQRTENDFGLCQIIVCINCSGFCLKLYKS
jgi:hypothetical protein